MSRLGIIANPYSKLNKRNPSKITKLKELVDDSVSFYITRSIPDLSESIRLMAEDGIDMIGICGGDGSISLAITEIIRWYEPSRLPKIAVLKGGTMNLLASQLKQRGGQETLVKRLIHMVRSGQNLPTKRIATLRVGKFFGFVYADGSALNVLEEFYLKKPESLELLG